MTPVKQRNQKMVWSLGQRGRHGVPILNCEGMDRDSAGGTTIWGLWNLQFFNRKLANLIVKEVSSKFKFRSPAMASISPGHDLVIFIELNNEQCSILMLFQGGYPSCLKTGTSLT
jgi:hypothetical protein